MFSDNVTMIRANGSGKAQSSAPESEHVDGSTGRFHGNVRSRNPEQPGKQSASWWTPELAELRAASMAARRLYSRHRRKRNRDPEEEARLYNGYRERKRTLSIAINQAKEKEKEELLKLSGEAPVQDSPGEVPGLAAADKEGPPTQVPAEGNEELICPPPAGVPKNS